MTDQASFAVPSDDWVEVGEAAGLLGLKPPVLYKLIAGGHLPVLQLAGEYRTAQRLPRDLVMQARRAVFLGAQVELRAFAREWAASNAAALGEVAA